jgi:hypothetical protein
MPETALYPRYAEPRLTEALADGFFAVPLRALWETR